MVRSGFREYEEEKLLQAGERNFLTSYSRNPERTIKSTPVLHVLSKNDFASMMMEAPLFQHLKSIQVELIYWGL